eukprot:5127640-Amphidinium_carterae.5
MAAPAVAAASEWINLSTGGKKKYDTGCLQAEFTYSSLPQNGQLTAPEEVKRQCFVLNGRGKDFSLEKNGFALQHLDYARFSSVDVYDMHKCAEQLYPVVEDILTAVLT